MNCDKVQLQRTSAAFFPRRIALYAEKYDLAEDQSKQPYRSPSSACFAQEVQYPTLTS